jgi:hypothetical protein
MTKKMEINLDNLTSALKTFYGQKTEPVLLIFRHWVKNNYDIAKVTPEEHQKIEVDYLKMYHAAKPSKRADAIDLLAVYGEHFYRTTSPEERATFAIAIGSTPLEYEIKGEGFSMRELMQALKTFDAASAAPEAMLTECFERFVRLYLKVNQPTPDMSQLITRYRREPPMKSKERASAILKDFGVRLLDASKPEDMQKWKEVSGAREH